MAVRIKSDFDYLTSFRNAPRERWKELTVLKCNKITSTLEGDIRFAVSEIRDADESGAWMELGYESLEDFVRRAFEIPDDVFRVLVESAKYFSLELPVTFAEARARVVQEMAASDEVKPLPANGEIGRGRSSDNVIPSRQGNSAEYIVRRLKRDAETNPVAAEALQELKEGKLKSARAAGIKAGIVKPDTPFGILVKTWKKATAVERNQFRAWLEDWDEDN